MFIRVLEIVLGALKVDMSPPRPGYDASRGPDLLPAFSEGITTGTLINDITSEFPFISDTRRAYNQVIMARKPAHERFIRDAQMSGQDSHTHNRA